MTFAEWDPHRPKPESVAVRGVEVRAGDRVLLRPRGGADAFDLALRGKTAVVVSLEQDFEDRIYLTVAVDDDPGRDYAVEGRPAHRFFFRPEEVEPLGPLGEPAP